MTNTTNQEWIEIDNNPQKMKVKSTILKDFDFHKVEPDNLGNPLKREKNKANMFQNLRKKEKIPKDKSYTNLKDVMKWINLSDSKKNIYIKYFLNL